jgi:hypothetical protein
VARLDQRRQAVRIPRLRHAGKNNASLSARAKDPMVAARLHGWINGDAAFEFLGFDMMVL